MVKQEKGVMWTVEAFLALLILLILVPAYMPDAPEGQDWPEFSDQVTAEDITYTLYETGLADENVDRGYTGNIEAAANIYSNNRLEVSGELKGVPSETLDIAFYAQNEEVEERVLTSLDNLGASSEQCGEDDLEGLHPDNQNPSEDEIYATDTGDSESASASGSSYYSHAYFIADSNGNYEMFWVEDPDCSNLAGPFFRDELFQWDLSGLGSVDEENFFYSANWNISDEKFVTYEADNVNSINEELGSGVSPGTETDVRMFNSSIDSFDEPLGSMDSIVLRSQDSVNEMGDINWDEEQDYFDSRGLLLMMNSLPGGLDFTGFSEASDQPNNINSRSFTEYEKSRQLENFFEQRDGELGGLNLEANGLLSNKDYLPENGTVLHGTASGAGNNPGNGNGGKGNNPGNGNGGKGNNPGNGNGGKGNNPNNGNGGGEDEGEVVSYRSNMGKDLGGSVGAVEYRDDYSEDDVKMISSLITLVSNPDNSFGDANGEIVTRTAIPGQLEGETLTPYRLELRWFQ